MILTVNGEILPEELGITMCHEHLAVDLSPVRGDKDSDFDDSSLIIDELNKMKQYGVKSVVEVSCNDMGRDVKKLQMYSKACEIHIIAATGFYLAEYHTQKVRESNAEELCDIFCKDILEGIDDTGVKAGVIGEVASGEPQMRPSEKNVLTAAAMAGKKTGVAVTTHCQLGKLAQEQIEIFEQQGMDLTKVVLGHLDLANDRDYYEKILKTGVNIGFDTIGKTAYLSDEQRADNLLWLIERGWEKQIVLSQDISRKSYLSRGGKYSGYMTVMKDFVPLLRARGIKQETLNRFLIENPARIFDKAD